MKSYFKFSMTSVLLASALFVLAACNDTWKEHYSNKTDSDHPVDKLEDARGERQTQLFFLSEPVTISDCSRHLLQHNALG